MDELASQAAPSMVGVPLLLPWVEWRLLIRPVKKLPQANGKQMGYATWHNYAILH
ncbi:MAG: hypothetical protein NVSMB27_02540 [Ktedonobacteraceae bacterium]